MITGPWFEESGPVPASAFNRLQTIAPSASPHRLVSERVPVVHLTEEGHTVVVEHNLQLFDVGSWHHSKTKELLVGCRDR